MDMSEGPQKQILSSPLTEVHFTFDAAQDPLPDQKAIIAKTIHALEINHGREIHIGDIEETCEDGRIEHSVTFRSPVSNPGVLAPQGVFTAHDTFQNTALKEERSPEKKDQYHPDLVQYSPDFVDDLVIGAPVSLIGAGGLITSSFLEISWMSNSAYYLGAGFLAWGALHLCLAARSYFRENSQ